MLSGPLKLLTVTDLNQLVADGVAESDQIEFKRDLPSKGGHPDPWYASQSAVGDRARNEIIGEVIAFANAHGGTIFVGIDETSSAPHRASGITPIPSCAKLAERFSMFCRDIIEPQVPMLEVESVVIDVTGNGVLMIRAPRSRLAPHRHTQTLQCYIRRRDRTEKMSMREIQDLTLQTERGMASVERKLEARRQQFKSDMMAKGAHYGFRCTFVPLDRVFLEQVYGNPAVAPIRHGYLQASGNKVQAPGMGYDFNPILRGTEIRTKLQNGEVYCTVSCDGVVENAMLERQTGDSYSVYVSTLLGILCDGLCTVEKFRLAANAISVEYALEIETNCHVPNANVGTHPTIRLPNRPTIFPLYAVQSKESFQQLVGRFEKDFWNSVSRDLIPDAVNFDRAFHELKLG